MSVMVMVLAAAASVRDISWLCRCGWQPPDYTRLPHQREWTLTAADPACTVHGDDRRAAR